MKVQATDLSGLALNWAVAKAYSPNHMRYNNGKVQIKNMDTLTNFDPSNDRVHFESIMEEKKITVRPYKDKWEARMWDEATLKNPAYGHTEVLAGLRCYVASEIGEEIDIPDFILNAEIVVSDNHLETNKNEEEEQSCDKPGS